MYTKMIAGNCTYYDEKHSLSAASRLLCLPLSQGCGKALFLFPGVKFGPGPLLTV